jgi:hypothetical protein
MGKPSKQYSRDDLSRSCRTILSLARGRTKRASEVMLGRVVFDQVTGRMEAEAIGTARKDGDEPPSWRPWIDPTGHGCDCPDSSYRSGACKHLAALALHTLTSSAWKGLEQARPELLSIRRRVASEGSNGGLVGFDRELLKVARELARGRTIEPWDFVRAAREVALSLGIPL